jgi:hypothetical protein
MVKSPIEYAVGFLRATGLHLNLRPLHATLRAMKQCPGYSPGVNGWPRGEAWISAQGQVQRANFVGQVLEFEFHDDITPLFHAPSSHRDADAVIDVLAAHAKLTPTAEERRRYVDLLNHKGVAGAAPFNGNDPTHFGRAERLLKVLVQHPSYRGPDGKREKHPTALLRLLPPAAERSAAKIVSVLQQRLNMSITRGERELYEAYLNTRRDADGNVSDDPFDGTNPEHLDERVRGLLYMLAQNPSYQLR